jgi:thiamine biosynthesis lipoprotein
MTALRTATRQLQVATRSLSAIGTRCAVVVTDPDRADEALAMMAAELEAIDGTCSRFRSDSELRRLEVTSGGQPVPVSRLLFDALEVADAVAVMTAGIVDPTIGSALIELGYDRDFALLESADGSVPFDPQPAPGWWRIRLDDDAGTVAIPEGVHVDLGATAKAWAADRSARSIAEALDCGVLVDLGGDVAVAGRCPHDGWSVGIAAACTTPVTEVDQAVAVFSGGLATSGTRARSWTRHGRRVHHIIDPWTGDAAAAVWSLVSTTSGSCVEANGWSTAAVVWGEDAVGNLASLGVPARLVDVEGRVTCTGGWPEDDGSPAAPAAVVAVEAA